MMRSLLFLCVTIFFNTCTIDRRGEERSISQEVYEKLLAGCSEVANLEVVIYYFDADCALCMAEVLALEEDAKQEGERTVLFIARTLSPERFAYQAEQQGVQSCILFDTEGLFAEAFDLNDKVLLLKDRVLVGYEN